MMKCPKCQSEDTHVLRTSKLDLDWIEAVKRKRECYYCGNRWVTVEVPLAFLKQVESVLDVAITE